MRHLIAAAVLCLTACSGGEDLKNTEAAIARFHQQVNAGQFDQIYVNAATDWKQAQSPRDSVKFLSAVRDKMGAFQSGETDGWRINYATGGSVAVVQYKSKFQKGDAIETFTYQLGEKAPTLVGYNINSNTLITR